MDVQGSLDDEIEINFSISPAVRRLRYHDLTRVNLAEDLITMFVTPSIAPNEFHKWMQESHVGSGVVEAKATAELNVDIRRGWHDIAAFGAHALTYLVGREEGETQVDLELFDGQMLPEQVQVKMGPVRLRVHNNTDMALALITSFLGDDDDVHPAPNYSIQRFLTGKRILTSQTFRRYFKAETIDTGTGLQIKNLTVLFTDLQASTMMYERVGDLKALDIVRRHFEVLEGVVARHRGAVVKTIGDAVMAVFAEADYAMRAGAEMIENVRRAAAHGEDLVLKIGMHAGACVAIQSNNQVDYFGRTVNIAARVQGLAVGGEIVCTEDIWTQPGVQDVVAQRGLSAKREQPFLKGIADRFPVRRIVVANVVALPARPASGRKAAKPARAAKSATRSAPKARARAKAAAKPKAKRGARAR